MPTRRCGTGGEVDDGRCPRAVVLGPTWRRHGERRRRAARVARLLRPVANVLGLTVSTELAVASSGRWYRPDVGVVDSARVGVDGWLASAPPLVVVLGGPLTARDWMRAGAVVVWAHEPSGPDGVARLLQWSARGSRERSPREWFEHPGEPALRVAAGELLPPVGVRRVAVASL